MIESSNQKRVPLLSYIWKKGMNPVSSWCSHPPANIFDSYHYTFLVVMSDHHPVFRWKWENLSTHPTGPPSTRDALFRPRLLPTLAAKRSRLLDSYVVFQMQEKKNWDRAGPQNWVHVIQKRPKTDSLFFNHAICGMHTCRLFRFWFQE